MARQLTSESEALGDVLKMLGRVMEGRWMVAVWGIEKSMQMGVLDRVVMVGRTTWDFPDGDHPACIEMLRKECEKKNLEARPGSPPALKVAEFLRKDENDSEEAEPSAAGEGLKVVSKGEEGSEMDDRFKQRTGMEDR